MNFFVWMQLALVCLFGAMSPGPSLAVVIRNCIAHNRTAGILTSVGHGLGMLIYASIVRITTPTINSLVLRRRVKITK